MMQQAVWLPVVEPRRLAPDGGPPVLRGGLPRPPGGRAGALDDRVDTPGDVAGPPGEDAGTPSPSDDGGFA